jgi:hypothetical protein
MDELQQLAEFLHQLKTGKSGSEYGLHPARRSVRADYLFVKAQDPGPGVWHRLVDDGKTEAYLTPEQGSLTGDLIDILLVDVTTTFGQSLKIDLIFDVRQDIPIIVRSGATSFSESVLRALMSIEGQIIAPITITPSRADKSAKAVFVDLQMGGKRLLLNKNMPRLITWDNGEKARRGEILETFLPAVNVVRAKLGLDPLAQPIVKADLDAANAAASSAPRLSPTQELYALVERLNWRPDRVVSALKANHQVEKFGSLTISDQQVFLQFLKQNLPN